MNTLYTKNSSRDNTKYSFDFNPDIIVLNLGTNEASYLDPGYGGSKYAEQFPADYKDMLTLVRSKNPNAYIICLYGMMGNASTIDTGIRVALNNINDSKIVYNPFTIAANTQGADAHPTSSAQEAWGKTLADYIKTLI
jgi:lysophospholipase L1-like esterase